MKAGDRIQVITKDEVLEGRFMPSPDKDILVLKLESGYNPIL